MKIGPGEVVIAILHSPREKMIGVLDEISAAGVCIRAIELGYFEEWSREVAAGEAAMGLTDYFFPMWRIERISRDEAIANSPSMAEQFEMRTGKNLGEF